MTETKEIGLHLSHLTGYLGGQSPRPKRIRSLDESTKQEQIRLATGYVWIKKICRLND